jgi:D-beta-D-heptose 7-phosphate kinase/D-beta-D-heptose 1-phosphate adenosyltransferase
MIELALALHKVGEPRILVIGDGIVDEDCYGHFRDHPAQEDETCPVFSTNKIMSRGGGATAVLRMAQALGAKIEEVIGKTAHKCRYFVGTRQVFRVDTAFKPESFLAYVQTALTKSYDCILISDYGKGVCTPDVLKAAIAGARKIPCIVDPHNNRDWTRYAGCTAIKCNWHEWAAIREDRGRHVTPKIIVTQGNRGMVMFDNVSIGPVESRTRKVVDVTGAGDMVLAALGVCHGLGWPDACKIANAAAGLKVERRGAVPVSRSEVIMDLCHGHKVLPRALVPHIQGKRVVFANGCFDLLGHHHVHLLREAKKHGDVLVVGVNDDASVRRLKGPKRPVISFEQRADMLAALEVVDWIVGFSEDSPVQLVKDLSPEVLVKGNFPERNTDCDSLVENVVLIDPMPNCSTTLTISKIAGAHNGGTR